MPDYSALLGVMKQAGVGATEAKNPVNVCFGKVTSASPLKILVEQKITLSTAQLLLTRNVTDYELPVTVNLTTGIEKAVDDNGGDDGTESSTASSHTHSIEGKQTVTIHNALQVGDKVLLLRVQGGQKYVVIDKVV